MQCRNVSIAGAAEQLLIDLIHGALYRKDSSLNTADKWFLGALRRTISAAPTIVNIYVPSALDSHLAVTA